MRFFIPPSKRKLPCPAPVIELKAYHFADTDPDNFITVIAASRELAEREAMRRLSDRPIRLRTGFRFGPGKDFTHWRVTLDGGLRFYSSGATLDDALSLAKSSVALPKGMSLGMVIRSIEKI